MRDLSHRFVLMIVVTFHADVIQWQSLSFSGSFVYLSRRRAKSQNDSDEPTNSNVSNGSVTSRSLLPTEANAGMDELFVRRELLDDALVVACDGFGRTPDNGVRGGTACGRDHNPNAMTIWLEGGGCKASHTIGATDELDMTGVAEVHPVCDFHVTLLRLLGLGDNKLTYYHAGRFKQLSQFGGKMIHGLVGWPKRPQSVAKSSHERDPNGM